MADPIDELGKQIEALTQRLAELSTAADADPAMARSLLTELQQLEEMRREAIAGRFRAKSPADPAPPTSPITAVRAGRPTMPVRERALAALDLLGVPLRGGLVSAAALARTGLPVEPRQLASLRRSERASWESAPDRRPAYVVPALHVRRFDPLRGVVASSAWEPWRRLVGPLSPRADHLRAVIRLVENAEWAHEHSAEIGERYERLLWRLARSVPGVLEDSSFDLTKTMQAAKAELAMVDDEDRKERENSAKRLAELPAVQRLFGAGLSVVRAREAT
jgi:HAMP domain-containing protein